MNIHTKKCQKFGELNLSLFLFLPLVGGCMRSALATVVCSRGKFIFYLCVHAGCSWKTHLHAGPTFLKVSTPQKIKINAKMKDGNEREVSVYLLSPKGSLFCPLKLPESNILAKAFFLNFCQFSIYNGDNELLSFYL
jgi:hypothetical protein